MRKFYFTRRCLKLFFISFFTCTCFFAPDVFAQRTVSGSVKDAAGSGLPGATISVKGKRTTTVSNADGSFSIAVPDNNSILVISYVGYLPQEISVGSSNNLDIALQPSSSELNQVVVVGYGTQNKKDITGAVKSLKSESFNKGIINSPQQLLQGKVAGVNVTSASGEPGAVTNITVRGPGGVRTGSTPLFVVDGLPLDNSSTGGGIP